MHLSEDALVLHYYGEMEPAEDARSAEHLAECAACQADYTRLQRVLAAVGASPEPEIADGFERVVWARLEPGLRPEGHRWLSWLVLSPARVLWAAAVVALVAGAFVAGRVSRHDASAPTTHVASSASQVRERVLLADLGDHLDRSQTMLIDLVSAGPDEVDIVAERVRAEQLVSDNRLYRQTAAATGNAALVTVLDDLERVLVDVVASPDVVSAADRDQVRQQIDGNGLLFKVRVLSSEVRERQKAAMRLRAGRSS
jgi:hypothetical protein